jgi:Ca2+-binding RTX toxin-like protein
MLDGGTGADTLEGKGGNDIYIVDNVGDKVVETSSGGTDTVRSSLNWSLSGSYAEVLELTGTATHATGNSLANRLVGNELNNVLNGGEGADRMIGGLGDDTFFVDNTGDQVVEAANEGNDTVRATISYSIAGQYVENIVLDGSLAIDATGNGLANTLTGNGAANRLNGGTGADIMEGKAGNDIYVVDNVGDQVIEGSGLGLDTVETAFGYTLGAYVENLTLTGGGNAAGTGNASNNVIRGNTGANALDGASGADSLYGGLGNDGLTGGTGADGFYFDAALGASNVDKILDFSVADDTIHLSRTIFTQIDAGTLSAGAFVNGTAAADGDDRILYEQATGKIWYDADGNGTGAAVLFAQVTAGTALTNLDFQVYTGP